MPEESIKNFTIYRQKHSEWKEPWNIGFGVFSPVMLSEMEFENRK